MGIYPGKGEESLCLRFEEIREMTGAALDHSFLKYKKELTAYGYQVKKISMKEQTVLFCRMEEQR